MLTKFIATFPKDKVTEPNKRNTFTSQPRGYGVRTITNECTFVPCFGLHLDASGLHCALKLHRGTTLRKGTAVGQILCQRQA